MEHGVFSAEPVSAYRPRLSKLKKNLLFFLSGTAFYLLHHTFMPTYWAGMSVSVLFLGVACSALPSLWQQVRTAALARKLLCAASACGICWAGQYGLFFRSLALSLPPVQFTLLRLASYGFLVGSLYFVFVCLLLFWERFLSVFRDKETFADVKRSEWVLYAILVLTVIGMMTVVFHKTNAFYGSSQRYDVIYSSDSTALVQDNCYLVLTHAENDLRQPLFAVFSAPFTGIPYLIGRLLRGAGTAAVRAALMNAVQIVLLFFANFLLAKMLRLSAAKRVCFMLLCCSTYPFLLFTLMMEQYCVACFWLVFSVYLVSERCHSHRILSLGGGATLLTSLAFAPFMTEASPLKRFRTWFFDMVKLAAAFFALLVGFCRLDVILNVFQNAGLLQDFVSEPVTLQQKIFQYTAFIKNCFAAPDAGVSFAELSHLSWQQNPVVQISAAGVCILLLCLVSAAVDRKNRVSRLSAYWVLISVVILPVLGWGAQENGLILYSLYFGWAFLLLLFRLAERVFEKLKTERLSVCFYLLVWVVLLAINLPAIGDMIAFAVQQYPV